MLDLSVRSLIAFATHHPALQAGSIIIATFVLEDAATVLAAMAAQSGQVSVPLALGALYVGIVVGDVGLYGLGWLGARIPALRRLPPAHWSQAAQAWLVARVFRVVLICRFLPGVRLPAYTACGFYGADLRRFTAATALATAVWTSTLFAVSLHLGTVLMAHYGAWRWAGAVGLVLALAVAGRIVRHYANPAVFAASRH